MRTCMLHEWPHLVGLHFEENVMKNKSQWRHYEGDGVSNHRWLNCLVNRLFRLRSKKTSKLRVTDLCEGNSPVIGEFPTQRASDREMFPCDDDVIMIKKLQWVSIVYHNMFADCNSSCCYEWKLTYKYFSWSLREWHMILTFCASIQVLHILCHNGCIRLMNSIMSIFMFNNGVGVLGFGYNTDRADLCFNMLIDNVDREIDDTHLQISFVLTTDIASNIWYDYMAFLRSQFYT